jgi:hypothetical protein
MSGSETKGQFWGKALAALILVGAAALFYPQIKAKFFVKPCTQPITYSLGSFDSKFKISQKDFLADIEAASQIWEKAIGRDLFEYQSGGKLAINLVYDSRQQATDRLSSLGIKIETTQSSYNDLKSRYDSENSDYDKKKAALDALIAQYNTQRLAYDAQVKYWNAQGGAPKQQYKNLQAMQTQLNAESAQINQQTDAVNKLVDDINALANVLNHLGQEMNLNVASYNTIGASRGSEFEEGAYITDSSGKRIEIYEFNDQKQLVRLLAHELGHALGLEHVDDPNAIMYRLNEGTNAVPTTADLNELKQVCKI